jgi:hypothetical protein
MRRVNDPVYRRRALEFLADALLCAAAFAGAFFVRFLDEGGDLPQRYEEMLLGSVAFVALGKTLVLDSASTSSGGATSGCPTCGRSAAAWRSRACSWCSCSCSPSRSRTAFRAR